MNYQQVSNHNRFTPRFNSRSLLFILVIYELTRQIEDDIPWYMLFAKDKVLVDKAKTDINLKFELWTAIESKHSRIGRTKKEYIKDVVLIKTEIDIMQKLRIMKSLIVIIFSI